MIVVFVAFAFLYATVQGRTVKGDTAEGSTVKGSTAIDPAPCIGIFLPRGFPVPYGSQLP